MKLHQIIEARYVSKEPQYKCKNCDARFTEREMKTRQGVENVKYCPNCDASHHIYARTFTSRITGNTQTVASELHEAKYVGANRYFCIGWEARWYHGATLYDFGVTPDPAGIYLGDTDIVSVANSQNEALQLAKEFMRTWHEDNDEAEHEWHKSDYNRAARSWGSNLEQVEYSLQDDSAWQFMPHGDNYKSVTSMSSGR